MTAATAATREMGHRGDVQGLRALAVLLVIGIHAVGVPRAGFIGVDVFFVVSGFVIATRLRDELHRTGRIRLGRFYLRRAQRIAPAALVTLAVPARSWRLIEPATAELVGFVRPRQLE